MLEHVLHAVERLLLAAERQERFTFEVEERLLQAAGYDAARTIGMRVWGMVESKFASEHDALIANKLAYVLCGGQVAAGTELSRAGVPRPRT